MSHILEAKDVNKKVELDKDHELHILKDVDLEIEEGEFVSVMGPSGSGKSTLLYNISGMDRMTSGSVKLKGHDISSKRRRISEDSTKPHGVYFSRY